MKIKTGELLLSHYLNCEPLIDGLDSDRRVFVGFVDVVDAVVAVEAVEHGRPPTGLLTFSEARY